MLVPAAVRMSGGAGLVADVVLRAGGPGRADLPQPAGGNGDVGMPNLPPPVGEKDMSADAGANVESAGTVDEPSGGRSDTLKKMFEKEAQKSKEVKEKEEKAMKRKLREQTLLIERLRAELASRGSSAGVFVGLSVLSFLLSFSLSFFLFLFISFFSFFFFLCFSLYLGVFVFGPPFFC